MDDNINNPNKPQVSNKPSVPDQAAPVSDPSQAPAPVPTQSPPPAPSITPSPPTPQPPTQTVSQPSKSVVQPPPPPSQEPQVMTPEKKKPNFKIIIGAIIAINVIIWAFVAYNYFTNKNLSADVKQAESTTLVTQTPTVAPVTYSIEIDNGNIARVSSLGDSEILVDKENYEDTGITGFSFVEVSPDGKSLCFWSMPPSLEPALYYSDISGANVITVASKVTGCVWSNSSTKFAYVDDSSISMPSDIYIYNLAEQLESQMTSSTESATYRRYSINSWSVDNTILLCSYEEYSSSTSEAQLEGDCEIVQGESSSGQLMEI